MIVYDIITQFYYCHNKLKHVDIDKPFKLPIGGKFVTLSQKSNNKHIGELSRQNLPRLPVIILKLFDKRAKTVGKFRHIMEK